MVEELTATWSAFATRVEHLVGDSRRDQVDILRRCSSPSRSASTVSASR